MIRIITAASAIALAASVAACGGALPVANTSATSSSSSSSPSSTSAEPTAESSPSPVIEKRTVTVKKKIAFATKTVHDPSLTKGTRKVRTKGVAGVKALTYEVTLTDGVETGRELLRQVMTKRPVTQVIAIGTKEEQQGPSCDPNYEGACVPIASDVDCAGGSGNGPAYVQGPVTVVGSDIYDLDRDGDGVGCEAS
jgi:hypothetical protein